jgi:hypothetical protein
VDRCGWRLPEYVVGLAEDELGYVSLTEMESIEGPLGIGIEKDFFALRCLNNTGIFLRKRLILNTKNWVYHLACPQKTTD